ncbi:hypothetical protein WJ438_01845 [Streptomyces sp. GD-15H]
MSADGHGVVSHAGSRLLADLADATGLTSAFTDALRRLRPRGTGHDSGRIVVDLAVMLADGGTATADLAVLHDQAEVCGAVASCDRRWLRLVEGAVAEHGEEDVGSSSGEAEEGRCQVERML